MLRFKNKGFTLIELMITVVLLAIVVNMLTPIGQVLENIRLDYLHQRFFSSAYFAKSEAIKRAETVSMCQSNNGVVCHHGANWSAGWLVFVNRNANNSVDSGEEIIRVYNQSSHLANIAISSGQLLTYNSRGAPLVSKNLYIVSVTNPGCDKKDG